MMVLNGTGLTIVLDTRQSSAVTSDSSDHQSIIKSKKENGKHRTAIDLLEPARSVLNPAPIDPFLTFSTSCK
ncbi:hypothetical protein T08_7836, partial [Trichinella sp. T8]